MGPPDPARGAGCKRGAPARPRRRESGLDLLYLRRRQLPRHHARPGPRAARRWRGVELRMHQDIVLNTSTLVDARRGGAGPARRRRATSSVAAAPRPRPSGASASRPEIPGPRIAEAHAGVGDPGADRPARCSPSRPTLFAYARHRGRCAPRWRSVMPLYAGIERLGQGRRHGCSGAARGWAPDGFPNMPDGRARFSRRAPSRASTCPAGKFVLTTRRGKQFNSMTYGPRTASPARATAGGLLRRRGRPAAGPARRRPGTAPSELGTMDGVRRSGPAGRATCRRSGPSATCWSAGSTIPSPASPTTTPSSRWSAWPSPAQADIRAGPCGVRVSTFHSSTLPRARR